MQSRAEIIRFAIALFKPRGAMHCMIEDRYILVSDILCSDIEERISDSQHHSTHTTAVQAEC